MSSDVRFRLVYSDIPVRRDPAPASALLPPFDLAKTEGDILLCTRCDRAVMLAPFRVPESHYVRPNNILNSLAGALLTPQGGVYCPTCAGSIKICRVCGCTDAAGCQALCWWVSMDLCSECRDLPTPEVARV